MASNSLALGANAKKLQPVSYGLKAVFGGDSLLEFPGKAVINFHHCGTTGANEVVMVSIVSLRQQLEARYPISQVKSFDHVHALHQMQRPVNCCHIAVAL